ncbi:hypothetical protein ACQ4PT_071043 [Festuca glaucescens]
MAEIATTLTPPQVVRITEATGVASSTTDQPAAEGTELKTLSSTDDAQQATTLGSGLRPGLSSGTALEAGMCKLHVEALQNRANPENVDVVANALDNMTARMHIHFRCVYFQKSLLESGTLSAKCNTQMVIPLPTENYGASSEFKGFLEKITTEVNGFLLNPSSYVYAARTAGDA